MLKEDIMTPGIKDLTHFNYLLFHTHEEEMALTFGQRGAYIYDLEKDYKIVYCGLWGIIGILRQAKK